VPPFGGVRSIRVKPLETFWKIQHRAGLNRTRHRAVWTLYGATFRVVWEDGETPETAERACSGCSNEGSLNLGRPVMAGPSG
jgi:hypothetical protein